MKPPEYNFILLIEETQNYKLKICWIVWDGRITDFQPLKDTAFAIHPKKPGDEFEFVEYEMARYAKDLWEKFLRTYLIK